MRGRDRRTLGLLGRWVGLATLVLVAGCAQEELTRPPDPPLSPAQVAAVVLAVAVLWLTWTGLVVHVVRASASTVRTVVGGLLVMPVLGYLGLLGYGVAENVRRRQILGGGRCRAIPVEERPESIVEITCGGLEGLGYVVVGAYGAAPAVAFVAVAFVTLRDRPVRTVVLTAVLGIGLVLLGLFGYAGAGLVS